MAFIMFNGLFFEFLTPSILGAHNFLNFISFLMIFGALKVIIGGVQVYLDTINNGALLFI
jgi:hypothetical protein